MTQLVYTQETYKTTSGEVRFNASTPLEDIKAANREVNAILKTESGNFATVLLMKDFDFRRKLMQEHFNENYAESDRYPKSYLSGTIQNFRIAELGSEPKTFQLNGKLTIHGVTRNFNSEVSLRKRSDAIDLQSEFMIQPESFDIEIPTLLFKKIAQEVMVSVNFKLKKQ
ncbi:YceI family protein [Poritiphilus flavus]|uniref:YceI family protein n=1 Tax=Poritiphilus flavus TaxID=2697053 RepID=A0A6L9EA87_9FLAO|nr:YceI family protein [Poritiphilus flavus]NAS11685.1 YceI family protein [Poritiphilus flavus]